MLFLINLRTTLLLTIGLFVSCKGNPNQVITSPEFFSHNKLILAAEDEPGERLILNVIVKDEQTGTPVPNAEVYFYHADANGQYHPSDSSDESTAKFSGIITTDSSGKFIISTILPGEYEEPGNRHIHIHYARANSYKQTGGVILFDHNVNDEVRQWANETGYGIIIVVDNKNGTFIGNLNLMLTPVEKISE